MAATIDDSTMSRLTVLVRGVYGHSGVRYLLAGGLCFLLDFGLLALLHEVLGWPTWLSAGISFLVSFAFTYSIQRMFSFSSRAPHGRALVRYTILVGINTVATIAIVALVDRSALSWAGGKVIATLVTTVWNYFAYRYWVFAHTQAPGEAGTPERTENV